MITAQPVSTPVSAPTAAWAPSRSSAPELAGQLAIADIDLGAIAANTRWFAARASGARLMAVVKADAFGHGSVPVASVALDSGATWLGVARIREALELRSAGIRAPILAWLLEPVLVRAAIDQDIDLSASSIEDLECVAYAGSRRTAAVHLKLDTGLRRAGCPVELWPALIASARRLEALGHIRVRGIWSHLSHGDVPRHPHNRVQQDALAAGVAVAQRLGIRPEVTHLANSGGVIHLGAAGCSMVRVGAGLYGIESGAGESSRDHVLRPAMTLTAAVAGVRRVRAGDGVGYGHTAAAPRDTQLALVPLGYADGLPRIAAAQASLWCGDRRVPLVGRISMDQCSVDVGDLPVRVGDPVTVIGDGRTGAPTAADWAAWAGTIPHEILTHIGGRVPRRYTLASR